MLIVAEGVAPARFGSTGAMTSASLVHADDASKDTTMAYSTTQLGQDPQYDPFLSAPVGEDRRGSSVSVLSMLARLGVDPWREASELSRLPEGAARQRLEALMKRFHDVSAPDTDQSRIILKLLAFLPKPLASSGGTLTRPMLPDQGSPFYWIIAAALFVGWITMLAQG